MDEEERARLMHPERLQALMDEITDLSKKHGMRFTTVAGESSKVVKLGKDEDGGYVVVSGKPVWFETKEAYDLARTAPAGD